MNLKKCTNPDCEKKKKENPEAKYTLKKTCPECGEKTSEAHYKYINIKGKIEKQKY